MPTQESLARQIIDQKLTTAGWIMHDVLFFFMVIGLTLETRDEQSQVPRSVEFRLPRKPGGCITATMK